MVAKKFNLNEHFVVRDAAETCICYYILIDDISIEYINII